MTTKPCRYCKSDIPADATVCRYCQKSQEGPIAAIIFAIISAAITLAIMWWLIGVIFH